MTTTMTTTNPVRLTNYERHVLRENVKRGAAWLDSVQPDWFTKIDQGSLELSSTTSCVLGQLSQAIVGPEVDYYSLILEDDTNDGALMFLDGCILADDTNDGALMFLDGCILAPIEHLGLTNDEAAQRGFRVDERIEREDMCWSALNDLWREQIRQRVDA